MKDDIPFIPEREIDEYLLSFSEGILPPPTMSLEEKARFFQEWGEKLKT